MRVWYTVGAYDAVYAEVVVATVIVVEVAAVSVYLHTVLTFRADCLVNEVPDETTLQRGVFADEIPIFLKSAEGVAHCVGIFTLDQGLGYIRFLSIFLHAVISVVHGAEYVGHAVGTRLFILHCTAWVLLLYPFVGISEVRSISRFIAEAPEND